MVQPRPQQQPQAPEASLPEFMKNVEALGKNLNIPIPIEQWSNIAKQVHVLPELPESPSLQALEQLRQLRARQQDTMSDLQDLVPAIREGKAIPPMVRDAVFLRLALFLQDRYQLEQTLELPDSEDRELPDFLKPYLPATPSQKITLRISEAMLPMQYDVVESHQLSRSPRKIGREAIQLLQMIAKVGEIKLGHIEACMNDETDGSYHAILKSAGYVEPYDESDMEAVKLLVGYIAKDFDFLQQKLQLDDEEYRQLDLIEGIEHLYSSDMKKSLDELLKSVSLKTLFFGFGSGDLIQDLLNPETFSRNVLEDLFKPLANLDPDANETKKRKFREDAQACFAFFSSPSARRVSVELYLQQVGNQQPRDDVPKTIASGLEPTAKNMVTQIAEKVTEGNIAERLLNAALMPAEGERSEEEQQVAVAIHGLIENQEISLREAFELYYLDSIEGGNGFMLALKTIDVLKEHGYTEEAIELQSVYIHNLLRLVATAADPEDFAKVAKELNFSDRQQREMRNMALWGKEEGLGILATIQNATDAFIRHAPTALLVTTGLIVFRKQVFKTGKYVFTLGVQFDLDAIDRFVQRSPEKILAEVKARAPKTNLTVRQIQELQGKAAELRTLHSRARVRLTRFFSLKPPFVRPLRGAGDAWGSWKEGRRARLQAKAVAQSVDHLGDVGAMARRLRVEKFTPNAAADTIKAVASSPVEVYDGLLSGGYSKSDAVKGWQHALADHPLVIAAEGSGRRAVDATYLLPDRQQHARHLVGDLPDIDDAVKAAHEHRLTDLSDAYDELADARAACQMEKFGEIRVRINRIIVEKKAILTDQFNMSDEAADMLVRSGVCGCKSSDAVIALVEQLDTSLASRMRLSQAATETMRHAPRSVDDLRLAIRASASYDEVTEAVAHLLKNTETLDAAKLATVLDDAHLDDLAKTAGAVDDLKNLRSAVPQAADSVSRLRIPGAAGILTGIGLELFAAYIDFHLIRNLQRGLKTARNANERRIIQDMVNASKLTAVASSSTGVLALARLVSASKALPGGIALSAGLSASLTLHEYRRELEVDTNVQQYMRKSPEELMAIMQRQRDWLIDTADVQTARRATALDAYIAKELELIPTKLDQKYVDSVLAENIVWKEQDVDNPATQKAMYLWMLKEKHVLFINSVRVYLNDQLRSQGKILGTDIDNALLFARAKYMERRSSQLNDPSILQQYWKRLGVRRKTDRKMIPSDFARKDAEGKTYLDRSRESAARQAFIQLTFLHVLQKKQQIQPIRSYFSFIEQMSSTFLQHDIHDYMARMAGKTKVDRYPRDFTVLHLVEKEFGPLYGFQEYAKPEEFIKKALIAQRNIRAALDEDIVLDPRKYEQKSFFGSRPQPWKLDR